MFDIWKSFAFNFCDRARKTSILLDLLSNEACSTTFYLGITDNTSYKQGKKVLTQYFSPFEKFKKLLNIFYLCFQNLAETREHFVI